MYITQKRINLLNPDWHPSKTRKIAETTGKPGSIPDICSPCGFVFFPCIQRVSQAKSQTPKHPIGIVHNVQTCPDRSEIKERSEQYAQSKQNHHKNDTAGNDKKSFVGNCEFHHFNPATGTDYPSHSEYMPLQRRIRHYFLKDEVSYVFPHTVIYQRYLNNLLNTDWHLLRKTENICWCSLICREKCPDFSWFPSPIIPCWMKQRRCCVLLRWSVTENIFLSSTIHRPSTFRSSRSRYIFFTSLDLRYLLCFSFR